MIEKQHTSKACGGGVSLWLEELFGASHRAQVRVWRISSCMCPLKQ